MTADQLRKSILQQAIQGKLVPQDPNDEPASVLLERIREEKARLVEEKKIKKEKNPSVIFRGEDNSYYEKFTLSGEVKCIDEEIPFEIPNGWEWCRIRHITDVARGGSPRPIKSYITESVECVNWIKIGDTEKGSKYIHSTKEKIKREGVTKSRIVHKGDFLLTNSMSFGRPYITLIEGCIHDGWLVISPIINSFNQEFFYYLLSSEFAYNQFADKVAGAVVQNLNSDKVANSIFPLPPLAEQQRIVEKIEELIPHIELYGKAQIELDTLNKNIKEQLKKSVLQYAIEGKLVPQDEAEGSAEELLLQIQAEKQKLYEENKLKKKDLEHSTIFKGEDNKYYEKIGKNVICIDEEIPFEIPKDWRWCRLGVLTIFLSRGKSPKYSEIKKYPVFAQKCNLKSGKLSLDTAKFLDERTLSKWRDEYKLRNNDILINSTGTGTVGRVGIFSEQILRNYPFIVPDSHISVVRTFSNIDSYYIYYLMCSSIIQQYIEDNLAGSTNQKELYIGVLEKLLLPLPPLSEQQRIVNTIQNIFRCIEN